MQLTTRTTANYPTYQKNTNKHQVAFSGNIGTKIVDKCWENHDKAYGALTKACNEGNARHYKAVIETLPKYIEKKCPAFYKFANSKPGFVVRMIAEGIVGGIIGGTLFNKFY